VSHALIPSLIGLVAPCCDTGCSDSTGATVLVASDGAITTEALWGYVCEPCATKWIQRRQAWAAAHPGQPVPDWSLHQLHHHHGAEFVAKCQAEVARARAAAGLPAQT
jgi:hypothetical protein